MENFNFTYIFIGLAIAYAIQLLLTGWQAKRFFRRLKKLRKEGIASIGMAGGKWSGRTYAVLVVDDELNILHAEKMSGLTIFSKLKEVDGFVGLNVRDVLDETRTFPVKKKLMKAFRKAAEEFFDDSGKLKPVLQKHDANAS